MTDRISRLEAAVEHIRRIPQPFRPTLTGPTAVRKIFHKQDDALGFAKEFGPEMMVFSYESLSLGHTGQRFFLASGVESFFHYYRQMNPSDRCHYEVIPTYRPAKLYLDLEFSVPANPDKNGGESVAIFLKAIICALNHFYNVTVFPDDVIILDSSTTDKFSQHVVFNSPGIVFENNLEQGQFVHLICRALHYLASGVSDEVNPTNANPLCQFCNQAVQDIVKKLFPTVGITQADARCCLVRTLTSDHSCGICDLGVYTRNRNFRLAGSHKLTGTSVLWPLHKKRDATLSDVWPSWSDWAQTLVTMCQFDQENFPSKLLKRPVNNCICSSYGHHPSRVEPVAPLEGHETSAPIITQSLPVQLRDFLSTVLFNWYIRDNTDAGLHEKKHFESKVWKIRGRDLRYFGITVDGLRFCERVNRRHRSNHVILVFDLDRGCYHQKCLDPDCRANNFRSHCWPIPSELCNLVSDGTESHNLHPDYSFNDPDITDDDLMLGGIMDAVDVNFTEQF